MDISPPCQFCGEEGDGYFLRGYKLHTVPGQIRYVAICPECDRACRGERVDVTIIRLYYEAIPKLKNLYLELKEKNP